MQGNTCPMDSDHPGENGMEANAVVSLTHVFWQGKAGDSTSRGGGGEGRGREGFYKGG